MNGELSACGNFTNGEMSGRRFVRTPWLILLKQITLKVSVPTPDLVGKPRVHENNVLPAVRQAISRQHPWPPWRSAWPSWDPSPPSQGTDLKHEGRFHDILGTIVTFNMIVASMTFVSQQ